MEELAFFPEELELLYTPLLYQVIWIFAYIFEKTLS